MAQERKPTRAEKIAKGGKKPEAKQPKVAMVKEKGPVPASYAPNNTHKAEAERQAFAKKIADAKQHAFGLVQGESTIYLIGETHGDKTEGHYFEIFQKEVPATDKKEAFNLLLVSGDYPEDNPVSIPHAWLFKSIEDLERGHKFARGQIGDIQHGMLQFLQRVLVSEIADEKLRRIEDAAAAKKAAQVATALEHPGRGALFTLATSGGNPVQQRGSLKLSSLNNFGPKQFNRYNFSSGKSHCVVEYTSEKGVDILRIHSMHTEHELAIAGVKIGLELHAVHLNKECAIPAPDMSGLPAEVHTHLCLFRAFLIQSLDQLETKKQRKAA